IAKGISREQLEALAGSAEFKELEARRLVSIGTSKQVREVRITEKGKSLEIEEQGSGSEIGELTKEMLESGSWRGKRFSSYNIGAKVSAAVPAREHPLRRLIEKVRQAYIANGFVEIKGPIVESAFWVFDYLFVPQDHPAREAQDTFFTGVPERMPVAERELISRVKRVHEKSWHAEWLEETASQAVLRPHTTSVTGRRIYNIVSKLNKDPHAYLMPMKFFTIGRVFRNENLDYKHLADFYQTDGIIIGSRLTLSMLFDTLLKIYNSIGIEVKFKPSYFPFVEPGVEVDMRFGDEWLEMGGAGIIRKEVVGSTKGNIGVLAWGLGIERILLAKNPKIKSVTELYNSSIGWLRDNSIASSAGD
ncbi:MAG: phenylalanine--tRNA ligase subunit alpha, partial [Candidatus Micrarchaeaceae archaeon]